MCDTSNTRWRAYRGEAQGSVGKRSQTCKTATVGQGTINQRQHRVIVLESTAGYAKAPMAV